MKKVLATGYWEEACETLDTMHLALLRGNNNNVVTLGYQAMEQAAKALLAAHDVDAKSHRAVHVLVSRELVKTGKTGPQYSKELRPAFRQRSEATYSAGYRTTAAKAAEFAERAQRYLGGSRELLSKWGIPEKELAVITPTQGTTPVRPGGNPVVGTPGRGKSSVQAYAESLKQTPTRRRNQPGDGNGTKR